MWLCALPSVEVDSSEIPLCVRSVLLSAALPLRGRSGENLVLSILQGNDMSAGASASKKGWGVHELGGTIVHIWLYRRYTSTYLAVH